MQTNYKDIAMEQQPALNNSEGNSQVQPLLGLLCALEHDELVGKLTARRENAARQAVLCQSERWAT